MSKPTIIIDEGHGGLIQGIYQTEGKRSPNFKELGGVLYEGIFNRAVGGLVMRFLKSNGIACFRLDTNHDIELHERTAIYDKLFGKKYCMISIHANAAGSDQARGVEVYTSPGQTLSDRVAEIWYEEYLTEFKNETPIIRTDATDGDHDKEAKFWVLTKTAGQAILIEHPFMTNLQDCRLLWNQQYRQRAASVICSTITRALDELYA